MERLLENLSGPEVTEAVKPEAIFIQPVGAVEQHGPHLPLAVDHIIAHETAEAVIKAYGQELDLWLLPTLAVSKSNEHAWSPGTLWLSAVTLLAVLDDIARCVAATSCQKLVFLNAHGGNSSLLNVACRDIRLKYGLMTFLVHPSLPADQGGGNPDSIEIHGGQAETSVMLHLRPELVKMDKAQANVPEWMFNNEHVRFGGEVTFGWLSNDFGPGHIGDPTQATSETGKKLFEASVEKLRSQLLEIKSFSFGK